MSDTSIKKVIIKKEDLPAFNGNSQEYSVRYRIISEDKNRASHWSPYYLLKVPSTESVNCIVTTNNHVVNMTWQQPKNSTIKQYDIYFKLNNENWKYVASTTSLQFSSLIDSTVSSLMVAIQLPTYPKQYFSTSAIFTSPVLTV